MGIGDVEATKELEGGVAGRSQVTGLGTGDAVDRDLCREGIDAMCCQTHIGGNTDVNG